MHRQPDRVLVCSGPPTWKRLTSCPLVTRKCIPLVAAIFSDKKEIGVVQSLHGDDAQAFIDVIDEVFPHALSFERTGPLTCTQTFRSAEQLLDTLAPWLRRKCLSTLRRICSRHALLPKSAQIPLCYDRSGAPLYRGGYADVWKGEHQGRHVAVKVLRVYSTDDFVKITSVSFCIL